MFLPKIMRFLVANVGQLNRQIMGTIALCLSAAAITTLTLKLTDSVMFVIVVDIIYMAMTYYILKYLKIQKKMHDAEKRYKQDVELYAKVYSTIKDEDFYRDDGMTLELLCIKVGENINQVSRVINEFSGMNFRWLLNKFRIEYAVKRIHENPDELLWKIAVESGYQTSNTFITWFKKFQNMTPSKMKNDLLDERAKERLSPSKVTYKSA